MLLTFDLYANVYSHATSLDLSVGYLKGSKHLLKFTNDQLGVIRVGLFRLGINLQEWHARTIEIN